MKLAKSIVLASMLVLCSCASNQHRVMSTNTNLLVVGQKPVGYPITTDVRIGNTCTSVTESWLPFKDPASGKQLWLKQIDRAEVPCR